MLRYDWSACTKVFQRSLFDKQCFDKGLRFEDLALIPYIISCADRLCVCSTAIYYYYRHPESIMLSNDIKKEYEIFLALEKISCRLDSLSHRNLGWQLMTKVLVLSVVPGITWRYKPSDSRAFAIAAGSFLRCNGPGESLKVQITSVELLTRVFLTSPGLMRWVLTFFQRLFILWRRFR